MGIVEKMCYEITARYKRAGGSLVSVLLCIPSLSLSSESVVSVTGSRRKLRHEIVSVCVSVYHYFAVHYLSPPPPPGRPVTPNLQKPILLVIPNLYRP